MTFGADDPSAFFADADDATYDGAPGFKVHFDAAFLAQLGIAGDNPTALGLASAFPAAAIGKTLRVAGVNYTIRGRQKQDDGATVLLQLEEQ